MGTPATHTGDHMITSVWSAYGHRFIGDGEGHESCLTCGALYELVETPEGTSDGAYVAANGDDPMECTRDTGMAHGYPGERYCHEAQDFPHVTECEQGPDCSHVVHNCNCLLCA